jgi:phenylacetate-CoA ligase
VSTYTTHPDAGAALRETIELARRAPFYRDHLGSVRGESLQALPFTTKEDLRAASPWGMIAVPREKLWHYHESTGTTGEPIACWYRQEEFGIMGKAVARWFPELGPGTILLNRFPGFAPISFCFESAIQLNGACQIPSGNLAWDVPFPRAVGFLKTVRPQMIATLPLEMFFLWRLAEAMGIDPQRELDSLETAILAGAPLPPAMKRMVERDWGVRVREIYGSNETLFLGASCEKGSLHLETSLFIAEVVDATTLQPVREGEPGILVVTHLGPKAAPLVRYLTRDYVRVFPCECGRAEPAIEQLGRQDEVAAYGGKTLFTSQVLDAGYRLAERSGARIFFAVVKESGVVFRIEREDPRAPIDPEAIKEASAALGTPVFAEGALIGDVFDPTALIRTPQVYKPSQIASWIGAERKPLTILENLIRWPTVDRKGLVELLARRWRVARRRRQLRRGNAAP